MVVVVNEDRRAAGPVFPVESTKKQHRDSFSSRRKSPTSGTSSSRIYNGVQPMSRLVDESSRPDERDAIRLGLVGGCESAF
jgi:hypothetical protein